MGVFLFYMVTFSIIFFVMVIAADLLEYFTRGR